MVTVEVGADLKPVAVAAAVRRIVTIWSLLFNILGHDSNSSDHHPFSPQRLPLNQIKSIQQETEKSELPAANMKLIHSGKVLKDTETIANCQLKPNAFLVVMISKAKKKPAAAAAAVVETPKTPSPSPTPAATSSAPETSTSTSTSTPAPAAVAATPANSAPAATTPSAPSQNSNDNVPAEAVASLTAMGFPEAEVKACLRASGGNPDVAVEFLMNGIPDYASQSANMTDGTPLVSRSATGSGAGAGEGSNAGAEPLAQLRSHPQINQLRQLVQANPSTLQAVLTQIGQQQPELLQEINGNQELFLQIMNEPVSDAAPAANASAAVSSSSNTNVNANASSTAPALPMGAGGLSPEMMQGLGNPAQLAQMIDSMTPEQLQSMSAMMGLTPEQLRMTAQAISRMPPEELQNYMSMAMQGEGMEGMGAGAGAAEGGPGGAPPGAQVLRLSEEEMAAVDRLAGMGFDRSEAAQAYLACDKNEELAANLLMDGGFGFGDDPMDGAGGGNGDDMYD